MLNIVHFSPNIYYFLPPEARYFRRTSGFVTLLIFVLLLG